MNRIKYILLTLMLSPISAHPQVPNSWIRVADFGSTPRVGGVSFNIDSFGYVGLGKYDSITIAGDQYPTDIWQYNPYTNIWTQKDSFPGLCRAGAANFVIGSKVYVGLGYNAVSQGLNDFWQFDPSANTWTQKADFGGGGRYGCLAFSMGGKGYIGMGYVGTSYKKDLWEYDPSTDAWTQKNDFPDSGVQESALFNIGGKEYIGFGYLPNSGTSINDFWQYDPSSDTWTQLSHFSGKSVYAGGFAFTIGYKGYLNVLYDTSGIYSDYFWEYNAISDSWIQKDSFIGENIIGDAFFTIGNKGYAGIGTPSNIAHCVKNFWMYTPDSISTGIRGIDETSINIYPDPVTDRLIIDNLSPHTPIIITDMLGQVMIKQIAETSKKSIDVSSLPPGVYCVNNRKFVKE